MGNETMSYLQATSQILLTLATIGTLIVLIRYAKDTKTIAKNSSEQIEFSFIPFIDLVEREPGHSSNWAIKNLGKGPALNVSYSRRASGSQPPQMHRISPLAPFEQYSVTNEDEALTSSDKFVVEYESLSGKKYRTTRVRICGVTKSEFTRID